MLRLIKASNRGFSLIEAMIAICVTMVGVMAIFSLVAPSWRTATQSDEMGRAAHILYDQLQREEINIINQCNTVTTGVRPPVTVYASGGTTPLVTSDIPFSVATTITSVPGSAGTWRVVVTVTWSNGRRSVTDEITVTQQGTFKFGC
jgi:Tfp pilus assembly protein PilV